MKKFYVILICVNIILLITVIVLATIYFPARQENSVYKYDYSSLKPVHEISLKNNPASTESGLTL